MAKPMKEVSQLVRPKEDEKPAENVRLTFELSPKAARGVDRIAEHYGLRRRTETVRFALGMVDLLVDYAEKGYELLLEKEGEATRIVVPKQL